LLTACARRETPARPAASAANTVGATPPAPASRELSFGDTQVHFYGPEVTAGERPAFVLVLHGLGGNGSELAGALGLEALARAKRFSFAAPDGTLDAQGRRFWNANAVCCNFEQRKVDDVERLLGLINYAVGTLQADPQRVFVVGYSNGGFMAHRLACEHADRVRAIVSIAAAGPEAPQRCSPSRAVSVLEIHGSNDAIVPFDGGHLFSRAELPRTPSVRSGLEVWARTAHCEGALQPLRRLDWLAEAPGAETEVSGYASCRESSPLLWKVDGAGHVMPLGAHALETIWQFLEGQR
jgi:polyhydroxybutyrate depolymerase